MASKFPYRVSDDKALEKGEQVASARYRRDLKVRAEEIIQEVRDYPDVEVRDLISQAADRAVIYTKDALEILVQSDNWQALDDAGMELPSDNVGGAVTIMAYFAYEMDLATEVEDLAQQMGVEVNPGRWYGGYVQKR